MRVALTVFLALCIGSTVYAQEPTPARPVDAIPRYVEYGSIRFRDEKAMLDHWASQFRLFPDSAIYIFAYSGRRACKGEAAARAIRAKNYLVKERGIAPDRVIWKDGGFRSDLSVELWLRPRVQTPPEPTPTVDPTDAKVKDCRPGKRGRRGRLVGRA